MTVTVTPLSDACGAEVSGFDMRDNLSSNDVSTIYQAWLDHLVIAVRGQRDITPEDQKKFCSHLVRCAGRPAGWWKEPDWACH